MRLTYKAARIVGNKKWYARALHALAIAAALFGQPQSGYAQQAAPELPTQPILRIEAGQHVGLIHSIDTDAANRFAVTASYDKTVRVWSLPDGKLQRVLRLPIDYGRIGQAYAAAISPDGGTVAVGGWTGPFGHHNIFLFDRVSGALKQRLADLPDVITHLAYSPDGRRLAASLVSDGIRIFDALNSYHSLPSDSQYGDQSYSVQFDRTGRLVTASFDGVVRLYAADHYATPVARFEWKGHRPYSAAFSLDGAHVAAGALDRSDIVVLSGSDLTKLFDANVTGIPNDQDISSVAWSQDGRFLYAGGYWTLNDVLGVRRWSEGGRGAYVDLPVATGSINQLIGLKSGPILFSAGYSFGFIDRDGNVTQLRGYGALDLRGTGLQVSADGGIVEIDSRDPSHAYRFTLADRLVKIDPPANDALKGPITHAKGLDITNWYGSTKPAVNGAPIKLLPDERSLSVAIVPGTQHLILGADFSLHLLDQRGHDVWPGAHMGPGAALHVNITGNKRLIVAAYDDGTIRWHRLGDGKEVLALFIHPDGQRWVAWTPQGYYDASVGADELVGWHINHGYDRAPDFYPVAQFRDRFYRPDVIGRVLQTPDLDVDEAVQEADRAAGRPSVKAPPVSSLLTPVVELHVKDPAAFDRTQIQLPYSVRMPAAKDELRVEALVDGVKTTAVDQPLVSTGETRAGILNLTIPRRNALVSVIAYNAHGASEPAKVHVEWRGAGTDPKLNLYVLAIGISRYKDNRVSLHYAAKDADDFVALARTQAGEGKLYAKVIMHPPHGSLRDAEATRDAVLDELDWIKRQVTNTNDVAMIFLSGHGITTPDQHYRFLPYDYDPDRIERTTISDDELKDYLTKIGGKKIFFFDTCYSGAILAGKGASTQADVDKFANDLKAAQNGIVVFTSSTGNELSEEKDEWGNGAFAKAVVEGLRGAAARREVPVVMISDLEGYVSRRVKELTKGNQKPMVAMPATVEDFPLSVRIQ